MPELPPADSVAHYYDRNTRRFLIVGGGRRTHSIHRQLWGPGVESSSDAAAYIDRLLGERIEALGGGPELTILDMGCGVGGTLFCLAEAFPRSRLQGITISRKQHDVATRLIEAKGLAERCHVHLGDFQTVRLEVQADVVVAVESFVHARAPSHFFAAAADQIRPGGHLLIADDFLALEWGELVELQRRRVAELKAGWRAPALCTVETCVRSAAELGLELIGDENLTPLVRLGRPRDRALALLSPLFELFGLVRLPFFGNMIGGNALHQGLGEGLFAYRLISFRKN